jgi:lactam utilization protein B
MCDWLMAAGGRRAVEVEGQRVIVHGKNDRQVPLVSEVVSLLGARGIPVRGPATEDR